MRKFILNNLRVVSHLKMNIMFVGLLNHYMDSNKHLNNAMLNLIVF